MAYAFNEDRSKVDVYTEDEIDAMHIVDKETIDAKNAEQDQAIADEAAARILADNTTNARIDTLVDHGTGGIEVRELLWQQAGGVNSGTIDLPVDFDAANYDCLECECGVAYPSWKTVSYQRIPVTGGTLHSAESDGSNDAMFTALTLSVSGTVVTCGNAGNASSGDGGSTWGVASASVMVSKIYGIKYAQDCSAEVADIRVGYSGIVYPTAGDAVRGQVEDLEGDLFTTQNEMFDIVDLAPYKISPHYYLNSNGLAIYNVRYRVKKYKVVAGMILHLSLSADSNGVYLFQDNHESLPGSSDETNQYLIGSICTTAVNQLVVVPDGAYYLMVSELETNTTNNVKRYDLLIDYKEYHSVVIGKNLVGTDRTIYYPVKELHTGDSLTFSTSDGQGSTQSVAIYFFDKDKNQLDYWTLGTGNTTRTVTLQPKDDGTRYLKLGVDTSSQPIQVEMGAVATEYEPYFGNTKYLCENAMAATPKVIANQSFNAAFHVGATDFATKCTQFSALMYGDTIADVTAPSDCESFLFFTDPHLCEFSEWQSRCQEYIAQIQKYYNSTPTTFCLCGGDWLGNSDLPETACFKLGYIDGFMHSMFDNCYMLVGNHDTNYQGKLTPESSTYTTRLSNQSIRNLWYRDGKAYYEINGAHTRFFCFDTGIENQSLTTFSDYGYEQAKWFASNLMTNTSEHVAILAHILYPLAVGTLQPLTALVLQIAEAFNNRTSITVNGNSYNFAGKTGKVEFGLFGHSHADGEYTHNGIPCIMTTNVRHDESVGPSFDLVFVNYDDDEINLIRVGSGSNRTVSIA